MYILYDRKVVVLKHFTKHFKKLLSSIYESNFLKCLVLNSHDEIKYDTLFIVMFSSR